MYVSLIKRVQSLKYSGYNFVDKRVYQSTFGMEMALNGVIALEEAGDPGNAIIGSSLSRPYGNLTGVNPSDVYMDDWDEDCVSPPVVTFNIELQLNQQHLKQIQ